jgi:ribonuclease P protein component
LNAPPRKQSFGRSRRLRRRREFLAVQEGGRRVAGAHYLLFALPRPGAAAQGARLGITVSRKVGGAVVRNRVKRWVRESYRRMAWMAPSGMDLVVVARPPAAKSDLPGTAEELRGLLKRLAR